MKRSLLLLPALLCSNIVAQENIEHDDINLGNPEHQRAFAVKEEAFRLAQGPGLNRPGTPATPPKPLQPGAIGGGGGGFGGVPPAPGQQQPGAQGHRVASIVQRGPGAPFDAPVKRTLIVGFSKLDDAARNSIQEDMQIMSRVLDKAVESAVEGRQDRRMGIPVMALPGVRGENIYLEDYGPVFILNVPMPLAGPKKADAAEGEKEDSAWEEAKRELYQQRSVGGFTPMKYDPQKVEALKKEVIESLQYAANIRQLKSDQNITVVISGSETPQAISHRITVSRKEGEEAKEDKTVMQRRVPGPQQNTLTIRVKKADAEAFAKGQIKVDEFTKKALISTN